MGYFSNGAEGQDYEERYCRRCIYYGPADGPGCPVWGLHLTYNSEQNRHKRIETILSEFIPINGLSNGQCKMFAEDTRKIVHEMRCLECGVSTKIGLAP